jgi:negative regulator of sigma-B (phosphoserine phosphatase)
MGSLKTGTVIMKTPTLQWGVAAAPLPGQTESGDQFLVEPFSDGTLVAVVDALGHGHRASQIAMQAIDTMTRHAGDNVTALIRRCHEILRERYGATMSLASFDWKTHRMSWLGVGNVAGVFVPHAFQPEAPVRRLLVRGGVVGGDLPDLHPIVVALAPGDTLIIATDGIHEQFADELPGDLTPQPLAEHIFAHYAKSTDDALVLVARCCVSASEHEY